LIHCEPLCLLESNVVGGRAELAFLNPAVAYQPRTVKRPRLETPREQLQYLVDYEITIPDMSRTLGVRESTIKRRMREYNISIIDRRTAISNDDLDNIVRSKHRDFPSAG